MTEQVQTVEDKPKLKTILAKKLGMTQFYDNHGMARPATILHAGPCRVLQVKTGALDGYEALQLGFDPRREKNVSQPLLGHFKKAGVGPLSFVREIRLLKSNGFEIGDEIHIEGMFAPGDYVDVQGTSIGKGFAGVVKRWGFHGGPKTHGQSDRHRAPGSLAGRRSLGRVLPGKKMAGHLGQEKVTVCKMEVLAVEPEKNFIYLNGAVPGKPGSYIVVRETLKKRKRMVEVVAPKVSKKRVQAPAAKARLSPTKGESAPGAKAPTKKT